MISFGLPPIATPCPKCACVYAALRRRADNRPLVVIPNTKGARRVGDLYECIDCGCVYASTPEGARELGTKVRGAVQTRDSASGQREKPPEDHVAPRMDADLKPRPVV